MQLDGILVGVQKLKHMGFAASAVCAQFSFLFPFVHDSGDINKELDLQTRLLDELDSAVQVRVQ